MSRASQPSGEIMAKSNRRADSRSNARSIRLATAALLATAATAIGGAVSAGAGTDGAVVTMTIGLTQDLASPNVVNGYLVSDFELYNLQYATLTNKAAADFATVPGLAESWTASTDGLTYTYTLRDGLKWSDGTALTADDIVYTIDRSRDEEWSNHFSTVENITATALDPRTVQIVSSVPDPKLPTMDVYIVPKHIYEGIEDAASYDGLDGVASGAYSLDDWRSGQDWTMVRNPNYFGPDNGIDRIIFRVFSNPDAMVAALESGEVDFAHNIPAAAFESLDANPDIVAVAGNQGGFTQLSLNGGEGGIGDGSPALLDPTVREAIYHAIDRQVIVDRVSLGLSLIGTTLSPSADPAWVPDLGDEAWDFDPARSMQLLDEAGYADSDGDGTRETPDGEPFVLRYVERSESTVAAGIREFITGYLTAVGIGTEVTVMDDTQLYDAQIAGNYDMFVWGWTPFVDPDPMLSYFTCAQITTDIEAAGYNDANWCSEEYDSLYEEQKVELDQVARTDIVHEMLRLFNRESTYFVLTIDPDLQAYRTDRFAGWLQQPDSAGPVLFTNSSPTYDNLTVIDAGGDDGGFPVVPVVIGVAVVALVGVGALVMAGKRRKTQDDRE